jgi:hypothetical protein
MLVLGGGGGLLAILGGIFAIRRFSPAMGPTGATSGALAAARRRDRKDRAKRGKPAPAPAHSSAAAAENLALATGAVLTGARGTDEAEEIGADGEAAASGDAATSPVGPAESSQSTADTEESPQGTADVVVRIEPADAGDAVTATVEPPVDIPQAAPPPPAPKKQKPSRRKPKAPKPARPGPSIKQRAALRSETKRPKSQRRPTLGQRMRYTGVGRWFRRTSLGESLSAWSESRRVRNRIRNRRGDAAKGKRPD